jgi:hypothetical protein
MNGLSHGAHLTEAVTDEANAADAADAADQVWLKTGILARTCISDTLFCRLLKCLLIHGLFGRRFQTGLRKVRWQVSTELPNS